jgi:hypothetical protein
MPGVVGGRETDRPGADNRDVDGLLAQGET